MVNNTEDYATCDLYMAAALQASGLKMKGHSVDREKVYFHYEDNTGLVSRITQEYLARQLEIDALTLVDNVRSLKSFCAQLKRDPATRRKRYA